MKIEDILKRVEQRAQELGLSIAAVSRRATDSPDTIRNWDRAVRRGETFNPTTRTLQRVAQALDVSYAWLTTGVDAPDQPGLAEGDGPAFCADSAAHVPSARSRQHSQHPDG
jgi:transcriptional regulator with XRE-family HTH domain